MVPINNSWTDRQPKLKSQVKRLPNPLTPEDIARLSIKREEIIMILRRWHGYGRRQADRVITTWLYDHGQTHSKKTISGIRGVKHGQPEVEAEAAE